ncbi:MAG: hypothetical protein JRJ26_10745 [Deltaproteobacteria bacterium]|nr:hypothetical protein [Deltaproteobacteria bacterium]
MHTDEKKKFDKRGIERKIREGLISQKEYEDYLTSLPDVSHKVSDREGERRGGNPGG